VPPKEVPVSPGGFAARPPSRRGRRWPRSAHRWPRSLRFYRTHLYDYGDNCNQFLGVSDPLRISRRYPNPGVTGRCSQYRRKGSPPVSPASAAPLEGIAKRRHALYLGFCLLRPIRGKYCRIAANLPVGPSVSLLRDVHCADVVRPTRQLHGVGCAMTATVSAGWLEARLWLSAQLSAGRLVAVAGKPVFSMRSGPSPWQPLRTRTARGCPWGAMR
jgi:hypothetical protein